MLFDRTVKKRNLISFSSCRKSSELTVIDEEMADDDSSVCT